MKIKIKNNKYFTKSKLKNYRIKYVDKPKKSNFYLNKIKINFETKIANQKTLFDALFNRVLSNLISILFEN